MQTPGRSFARRSIKKMENIQIDAVKLTVLKLPV